MFESEQCYGGGDDRSYADIEKYTPEAFHCLDLRCPCVRGVPAGRSVCASGVGRRTIGSGYWNNQLPGCRLCVLKKTIDRPSSQPILIPMPNRDNQLSVNSRGKVKGNNVAFPTFPDSANLELKIPAADVNAKSSQGQDLQKSDPGARDGFALQLDIPVLPAEHKGRRTSLIARYILGIIIAKVGYGWWGYLSEETIAREARCGLWPVKNAKKQLEEAGLLDVNRKGKCHRYHVPEWVKYLPKTWVKPSMVRDDGLSIAEAVNLSDLKFRQGDNDATWPTIQQRH